METLNVETRAELRRLIDERRRAIVLVDGPPRGFTHSKSEEERLQRRRQSARNSYWKHREARCAAVRERYHRERAAA